MIPLHKRAVSEATYGPVAPSMGPMSNDLVTEVMRSRVVAVGFDTVAIVASPAFAAAVLGFALLEPDRVNRVVFLQWGAGEESAHEEISGRLSTGQLLLATWIGAGDERGAKRATHQILEFLAAVEAGRVDLRKSNRVVE